MGPRIRLATVALFCAFLALGGPTQASAPPKRCKAVLGQPALCSGLTVPMEALRKALRCRSDLVDCKRSAVLGLKICRTLKTTCEQDLATAEDKAAKLDALVALKTKPPPPPPDVQPWHIATGVLGAGVVVLGIVLGVVLAR